MEVYKEATRLAYQDLVAYFNQPDAVLAKGDTDDGKACFYRTEEGNKCAVGCRIPDELYSPLYERNTVDSLVQFPELRPIIGHPCGTAEEVYLFEFLSEAQYLHDRVARDAAEFVNLITAYSKGLGLDY